MIDQKIISSTNRGELIHANPDKGFSAVVISGGTAFNSMIGDLKKVSSNIGHALTVSDDGGSSGPVRNWFGGPSIGDIRSRLIRLAEGAEDRGLELLQHRLHHSDSDIANQEWQSIVRGDHEKWNEITPEFKYIINAHLRYFDEELKGRNIQNADLRNGSIGNFFFTGSRLYYRSLRSAIYDFSRLVDIPIGTNVVPNIIEKEALTIGAELLNGNSIFGQNDISHPSLGVQSNLVNKNMQSQLSSPIKRLFYIDSAGELRHPNANPMLLQQLRKRPNIVYAPGSLFTSIMPSLILPGVGETISKKQGPKIAMLNGGPDREFSGSAVGYLSNLTNGLNRYGQLRNPTRAYVSHLLVPDNSSFQIDESSIKKLDIQVVKVRGTLLSEGHPVYDSISAIDSVSQLSS